MTSAQPDDINIPPGEFELPVKGYLENAAKELKDFKASRNKVICILVKVDPSVDLSTSQQLQISSTRL